MDEEMIKAEKNVEAYNQSFISRFGAIDPNQNWGFENMQPVNTVASTRSSVYVNVNKNEWGKTLQVPGNKWVWTDSNNGYYVRPDGTTGSEPLNDVTDEERKYVYNWFATHQNPTSIPVQWTEFFIQQVCSEYEHSGDKSAPLGFDYLNNCTTEEQRNSFLNNPERKFGMDELKVYQTDNNNPTHINNFNNGGNVDNLIQFVQCPQTDDFSFRSSWSSNEMSDNYCIQYLSFDIAQADGSVHHYEGWYMGFDYEHHKNANEPFANVDRDYYFCDWIVKITPGLPMEKYMKRVFCEDLGSTGDIDFNDLVFDVYYYQKGNTYTAVIILRAVGGTMPIYIEGQPTELHELFNASVKTPVNVHAPGGVEKQAPVIFHIDNCADSNPKNLKIRVESGNAITYIHTYQGGAAQSFAAPTTVNWLNESQQIENGYPDFKNWVGNAEADWNSNENESKWYSKSVARFLHENNYGGLENAVVVPASTLNWINPSANEVIANK